MENSIDSTSKCCCPSRLSVCGLSGAFGVMSALVILVLGGLAMCDIGLAWVSLMSSLYIGFAATPVGIAIGVVWAFLDGAICGVVVACVYNLIVKCCPCKYCHPIKK